MKKQTVQRILLLLLLVLQIAVGLLFAQKKQGYHEDEMYTYYSTNGTNGLFLPDREWQNSKEILKEFVVLPGENFDYARIKEVQSWDVHPPLYYFLFHTVCDFFPGRFSKWPGIFTNLIAMVLCFLLMERLLKTLGRPFVVRFLVLALIGLNPMTISALVFFRMYFWLTVFVLACANLHVEKTLQLMEERAEFGKESFLRFLLPLMIVSYLGFLTQYFYLIFFVLIGVAFSVVLLQKKGWRAVLLYVFCCASSLLLAVLSYPASAAHIFRGYRGKEAAQSAVNGENLWERFSFFAGLLNDFVFGGGLFILLALCVAGGALLLWMRHFRLPATEEKTISGRRGLRVAYGVLLFGTVGYFLVVSKVALLAYAPSNRYEMPVYPLLLALVILLTDDLLRSFLQEIGRRVAILREKRAEEKIAAVLCAVLFLGLTCKGLFADHRVLFLYPENAARLAYARTHREDTAILLMNPAVSYRVWHYEDIFMNYPRLYFADTANTSDFTDPAICNAKALDVYVTDPRNQKELLQMILRVNPHVSGYQEIYTADTLRLYHFE